MIYQAFFSPLEQFEVIPIIPLYLNGLDFSITNETIILILVFSFINIAFFSCFNTKDKTLNLIPSKFQILFEFIYKILISLIVDNLGETNGQPFFPIIFTIFFFIVTLNLIGLIPYSFTLTSHLIVTFSIALFIFIALNIICIRKHGFAFFLYFYLQVLLSF